MGNHENWLVKQTESCGGNSAAYLAHVLHVSSKDVNRTERLFFSLLRIQQVLLEPEGARLLTYSPMSFMPVHKYS